MLARDIRQKLTQLRASSESISSEDKEWLCDLVEQTLPKPIANGKECSSCKFKMHNRKKECPNCLTKQYDQKPYVFKKNAAAAAPAAAPAPAAPAAPAPAPAAAPAPAPAAAAATAAAFLASAPVVAAAVAASAETPVVSTTFESLMTSNTNKLLCLGAGTQGLFKDDQAYILNTVQAVQQCLGTDTFLDRLAERYDELAEQQNITADIAVVTLNIFWEFDSQYAFHGSLATNDIPEPNETDKYVGDCLSFIDERFAADKPVDIVFLGVGLSDANGKGFPHFLARIPETYTVERVIVVDILPSLSAHRKTWLNNYCKIDGDSVEYISQSVEDWLQPWKASNSDLDDFSTGPTVANITELLRSQQCADAHCTHDTRVREFIDKLCVMNDVQLSGASARVRKKPRRD